VNDHSPALPRRCSRRQALASWLSLATASGCVFGRADKVALPRKHSLRADQLLIQSDFKLDTSHPLVEDLLALRQQVSRSLSLPLGTRQVLVYLFSDDATYRRYWEVTYPGLPIRRAYFVQSPSRELAVYTAWGDRVQEDLRHEFTHGLLHASLEAVPLWLDEGLAEYFEVIGSDPGTVNQEYAHLLTTGLRNGWRPDMARLETLEEVKDMQRADYREAWLWVHWMLHGDDSAREVLLGYLRELRTNPNPGKLSSRVFAEVPSAEERVVAYTATLPGNGLIRAAAESAE
jgi:hypothetical protein